MKEKILVRFEVKADQITEDDGFFYISGYGSVFGNVDLGRDVVMAGAFAKCLERKSPIKMLWQHDANMPIGVWSSIKEDSYGLLMQGKLPKNDTFVSGRVVPQLKAGSLDGLSIGYYVQDFFLDNNIRYIKEADLVETSIVTFPMNPAAVIHSMKAATAFKDLPLAEDDTPWDSAAAVKRVRDHTNSMEAPSAAYKDAFFWYDSESPEDFTAYKLPFADVIDGKLMAIPRAIFAAAAAINGARGGVDIPESDIAGVKRSIDRYYDKMDRESPFGKMFNLDHVIDIKSKRDFERLLRESGAFSKKAAIFLASQWGQQPSSEVRSDSADVKSVSDPLRELLETLKSARKS